jgi:hypothetical protein
MKSMTTSANQDGIGYIRGLFGQELASYIKTPESAQILVHALLDVCFEKNTEKFVIAIHNYDPSIGGFMDNHEKTVLENAIWTTALHNLEQRPEKTYTFETFQAACWIRRYCGDDTIGRAVTLIRNLIRDNKIPTNEICCFVKRLVHFDRHCLAPIIFPALLEFRTGDPGLLWFQVEEAYEGKFKGIEEWLTACKLEAGIRALVDLPIVNSCIDSKIRELYRELEFCFVDPRDVWDWLTVSYSSDQIEFIRITLPTDN